jgi:glutathione synthase
MSRRPFRFLWITDPWDTLDHPNDTTLRLAEEALRLGHESHWCDLRTLTLKEGKIRLQAQRILAVHPAASSSGSGLPRSRDCFQLSSPTWQAPSEFDSVHYRTDPPVDLHYLHPLQLLALGLRSQGKTELVNPFEILTGRSEKWIALEVSPIAQVFPPSCVSALWAELDYFGRKHGRAVLKPLHQAQSKGIEKLEWGTPSKRAQARKKLAEATEQFQRPVLLQKYLKGIEKGEQRLWFLDGRLLTFVRKLPLQGDFRVDMDRGSRIVRSRLTAREKAAALKIGKFLKAHQIRLAAIDLIDGYATDFNFTSPGLLVPIENLLGKNYARPIIEALTHRAPSSRARASRRKTRA